MTENWKPVVGYEGLYEVSDHGNVRSLDRVVSRSNGRDQKVRGRVLNPAQLPSGHLLVGLYLDGRETKKYVHRLILESFRGPCPPGHEACHWDDDPSNNRLDNLRWGTRKENRADMVRNGNHNNARKTHCPQGHEFDDENTYVRPCGRRSCRECRRAQDRTRYARKQEAYRYQGHLAGRREA